MGTGQNYDYPRDRESGWSHHLNGVTHDEKSWYITQQHRLWKFPVEWDLNNSISGTAFPSTGIPTGHDHFGDLDFYEGHLYVAMEKSEGAPLPPGVAVFDTNLVFIGWAPLQYQAEASWCAINPLTGLLYSSNFYLDKPIHCALHVHRPIITETEFKLEFVDVFPLFEVAGGPRLMARVQGGAFSERGHLYLVVDDGTGIVGFDMLRGRQSAYIYVDYKPSKKEELEGITIWDLDNGVAPNIIGQIHLLMIDTFTAPFGLDVDDLYFKHYQVAHLDEKGKI